MPNWIRKSLVVFVSILTFGLVSPSPSSIYQNNNDKKPADEREIPVVSEDSEIQSSIVDRQNERDKFLSKMMQEAETQSYKKFGNKIKPVIEDEFRTAILPNMEKAIKEVTSIFPEEDLSQLTVTELPSPGNGEKIFHIRNTDKDVIRFHVRRDRPPQEGYWFNFHYHTYHDEFTAHHYLGEIYWDKNTPPKWMS
ncbi:YpjP family protein [Niallia sp. 03133]|uniref:YpjP family protein n=1 Tax=Niallia sp. 03133 TaxID=3458060 RepID=UPI004044CC62